MQAYCNNLVDHHMVLDLAPHLAAAFFAAALPVTQTAGQAAILVLLGLQRRELGETAAALQLPAAQVLTLFLKSVKRFTELLKQSREHEIERSLPRVEHLQVRTALCCFETVCAKPFSRTYAAPFTTRACRGAGEDGAATGGAAGAGGGACRGRSGVAGGAAPQGGCGGARGSRAGAAAEVCHRRRRRGAGGASAGRHAHWRRQGAGCKLDACSLLVLHHTASRTVWMQGGLWRASCIAWVTTAHPVRVEVRCFHLQVASKAKKSKDGSSGEQSGKKLYEKKGAKRRQSTGDRGQKGKRQRQSV